MTGRQHVPPDQYNRAEVSIRGLACPFAKSDPETYMNSNACRTTEGFKELRELSEHIWRKHTWFFRCEFCPIRWNISMSRKKVSQKKEEHWKTCEGKRYGRRCLDRFDEAGMELLDREQQERFETIKPIRGVEAKLKALYKACGKPVPQTYYTDAAVSTVQPQVNYGPVARTARHHAQQPASHRGDLFDGFVQPPSDVSRLPRRRTTANNVSNNAVLQASDGSQVSGANRPPDSDSGYGSMPRNDGDAAQSGAYWPHSAHVRTYEASGSHVAAASSGHIANEGESFPSIHDHVYHGCFQDYGEPSPYGTADSSASLLGLTLPSSGAESTPEPLDLLDFTNIDPEFLEYQS